MQKNFWYVVEHEKWSHLIPILVWSHVRWVSYSPQKGKKRHQNVISSGKTYFIFESTRDVRVVTGNRHSRQNNMENFDREADLYLSFLFSAYNERAYPSTSKKDCSSEACADSKGSLQHPGIEPRQYEPYISDTWTMTGREDDDTSSNEEDEGPNDFKVTNG